MSPDNGLLSTDNGLLSTDNGLMSADKLPSTDRRTRAPQQGDVACLVFLHASEPITQPEVPGKTGLFRACHRPNLFTLPQIADWRLQIGDWWDTREA